MYHLIADICRRVDSGESLKKILYGKEKDKYIENFGAIRALTDTTLRNKVTIDDVINRTELAREIVFNEVWVARVLVAEILFGRKSYHCTDGIGKKVYQYKEELKEVLGETQKKEIAFIPRYCRINIFNCTKKMFHSQLSSQYILKEAGGKSELTYEDFLKVIKKLKKDEYIQDYHFSDIYIFHPKANLTSTSLYQENKIILQDKASCLVAPLLGPTPGCLMIDMCAAPGFKTQHLATVAGSSGLILAIDNNKDRYSILANTRINYDLANVMTFNADSLHLPEMATRCIEYVLLDAPCSGSGVVQNYDYGTENRKSKERLNSLHNLQTCMLRTALTKYTSARRIVYSTCSIFEEENEAVVEEVLDVAKENQFVLVNLKNRLQDFGIGFDKYKCGSSCIRLVPEQSCTNGFFIALFERSNPPNPTPRTEFYKNLNEIIAGISCRKKRKPDDVDLEDMDEEADEQENLVIKNIEKKNKETFVKSEDEEQKNFKLKDEKGFVQNNLNQSPSLVRVKKMPSPENESSSMSSDESSTSEEELKQPSSTQSIQPEKNYIRVVRSPLLKNPVPPAKEESDDSEDDSDSDSDEEENRKSGKSPYLKSDNEIVGRNNKENNTIKSPSNNYENSGEDNELKIRETRKSFDNSYNSDRDNFHCEDDDNSWKHKDEYDNNFSNRRYYPYRNENYGNSRSFKRHKSDERNDDFREKSHDNYDSRGGRGRGSWRGRGRGNFRGNSRKNKSNMSWHRK